VFQRANSPRNSRTFKFSFWLAKGIVKKTIIVIHVDITVRAVWREERIS